jgi:hypothetical protein
MIHLFNVLTIGSLFVFLFSCTEQAPREKEESVKQEKSQDTTLYLHHEDVHANEVVSVSDFNKHDPFFSTSEETDIKWETIKQDGDSEKMFQYNASTIFAVDDNIIRSKIVDDNVLVNHGIHTGMLRDEFNKYFKGLEKNNTPTEELPIIRISSEEVYFSCCTEETQFWKFRFVDDTLYEITYSQYYD